MVSRGEVALMPGIGYLGGVTAYYTIGQAARVLRVDARTVGRWIATGRIHYVVYVRHPDRIGRLVQRALIPRPDIHRLAQARKNGPR